MSKTHLWQQPDFPHFYYNPAVVTIASSFK
jgi:hypothetical protein